MADKLSERPEAAVERLYEDGMDTRGIADLFREAAELARRVEWQPIDTAPERVRVLVCGGDTPNGTAVATNDPGRYTPYHESHHPLPKIQSWYSDTTRGSGKIWPAPTHWMPLPEPPEVG